MTQTGGLVMKPGISNTADAGFEGSSKVAKRAGWLAGPKWVRYQR
jgi:hypothetical protein